MSARTIALVANLDWNIVNFRLPLMRGLKASGCHVVVVCPGGPYYERIRQEGFEVIPWELSRRSINPLSEIAALAQLTQIYSKHTFDVVHHIGVKSVLYGSIAAEIQGIPIVVNNFTGLGYAFGESSTAGLVRLGLEPTLRHLLHRPTTFTLFQTKQDQMVFLKKGLCDATRSDVILGSGVNTEYFCPSDRIQAESSSISIVMVGRLLADKGVREFVKAASLLKQKGVLARFKLAGGHDPGNPSSLSPMELQRLNDKSQVELLGHVPEVRSILQQADIAVLPSYHEGTPRALLEAAACQLPMVASDIDGCRNIVRHGITGLLVPTRNADALADAIAQLGRSSEMRVRMGKAARDLVIAEFSDTVVVERYLALYRALGIVRN